MKKTEIKDLIIQTLTKDFEALVATANEAKDAATNPESKAENKYDTRGLEASYLAGAQAKRADELRTVIDKLGKLAIDDSVKRPIELTSLVEVEDHEGKQKIFFILPYGGGTKLSYKNKEIFVISAVSPVGKSLLGLDVGDEFKTKINDTLTEYEILSVI